MNLLAVCVARRERRQDWKADILAVEAVGRRDRLTDLRQALKRVNRRLMRQLLPGQLGSETQVC